MVVITCDDFDSQLALITMLINRSKFFAIDFEFSAAPFDRSLFDTVEERYEKNRVLVQKIVPLQFGITCFESEWQDDEYNVTTLTFPLFKKPILELNRQFLFDALSVVFLAENNFSFNESFFKGISYLNRTEKQNLCKKLMEKDFFYDYLNKIHSQLIIDFNETKAIVDDWYKTAHVNNELEIDIPQCRFKYYQPQITYLFKQFIYNDSTKIVRIFDSMNSTKIKVKKIAYNRRKTSQENLNEQVEFVKKLSGFQQVIELLISRKRPIIGHNCLIDFMILFNEFIEPLPKSFLVFKQKLHNAFPEIYDTKFITYETKNLFNWDNNSLSSLHEYFTTESDQFLSQKSNPVVIRNEDTTGNQQYHDSGYDSFCTGLVFLKIAHFITNNSLTEVTCRSITAFEHLKSMEYLKNKLHLMQCDIPYITLNGQDPVSSRPKQLFISIKNPIIDLATLHSQLKRYGLIEIKPLTNSPYWTALVAIGNQTTARNILNDFKKNKDFQIEEFSLLKYYRSFFNYFMRGTVITSSCFFVFRLFHKKFL